MNYDIGTSIEIIETATTAQVLYINSVRDFTLSDGASFSDIKDGVCVNQPNIPILLQGIRAQFVTTFLQVEIQIGTILAAYECNGSKDFNLKLLENFNRISEQSFGTKAGMFRDLMNKLDDPYETLTKTDFDTKLDDLIEIRNAILHYPFRALQIDMATKILPFSYSVKKKTSYIVDGDEMNRICLLAQALGEELNFHKEKWYPVRNVSLGSS